METTLAQRIGGFLFAAAEPVTFSKLSKALSVSVDEIRGSLEEVRNVFSGTGIIVIENDNALILATDPEISSDVESFFKAELTGDLGNAALETLSIILYSGPISKREIDYIRGVNSGYILRNLLIRGLIEKGEVQEGERSTMYQPTFELLSHMGVEKVGDLPEFSETQQELQTIQDRMENNKKES